MTDGVWLFTTIVGITDPADRPDVVTLPSWLAVGLAPPADDISIKLIDKVV